MDTQKTSLTGKAYRYAWDNFVPVHASIELTMNCNLRCVHCYNFDRSVHDHPTKKKPSLTDEEIHRLIDELAGAGALKIAFTGGEALLHKSLGDFVRHTRKRFVAVKVKTNGTLLNAPKAKELASWGVNEIDVSVYGAKAETHDAFTRVKGSFERSWEGILAAKENGIVPYISYVLHKDNVNEVSRMRARALEAGVKPVFSLELTARYDGTNDVWDRRVSPEQFKTLLYGENGDLFEHYMESTSHQCSCARTTVGISADGEVYPCIGAPIPSGSVREKSFREIWKSSPELNKIRGLVPENFKDCVKCPSKLYCQRSSGSTYIDSGDYTARDPVSCAYASIRREKAES